MTPVSLGTLPGPASRGWEARTRCLCYAALEAPDVGCDMSPSAELHVCVGDSHTPRGTPDFAPQGRGALAPGGPGVWGVSISLNIVWATRLGLGKWPELPPRRGQRKLSHLLWPILKRDDVISTMVTGPPDSRRGDRDLQAGAGGGGAWSWRDPSLENTTHGARATHRHLPTPPQGRAVGVGSLITEAPGGRGARTPTLKHPRAHSGRDSGQSLPAQYRGEQGDTVRAPG